MVDDVAACDYALGEEEERSARDFVVFAEEGQQEALVGEGEVAGEEAVLLRELCREDIRANWGGLLDGLVVVSSSVCMFGLRPDWGTALFACVCSAIVEAHLIEVIRMERIQVHP